MKNATLLVTILSAWLLLTPLSAYAYIDPGTGSMVIQLLLAGIAGAGVIIKMYWRRLISFIRPGASSGSNANHKH